MTPDIALSTGYLVDARGRIISTREPQPTSDTLFMLIRGRSKCAWAVRSDVPEEIRVEVGRLMAEEPRHHNLLDPPLHANAHQLLIGGHVASGPAFTFPDRIPMSADVEQIDDLKLIEHNFRGWTAEEIPDRSPIFAVVKDGYPVSICFCARKSEAAAEAGLETAAPFRGRGFGPKVTAAWAAAIRASGRIPLYSTSWTNEASRAVAQKLGLEQYASNWSLHHD